LIFHINQRPIKEIRNISRDQVIQRYRNVGDTTVAGESTDLWGSVLSNYLGINQILLFIDTQFTD
jgi:hypothetical protein